MAVIAVTMAVIAVTMAVIAVALPLNLQNKQFNPCLFFVRFN
jgi:uncharacterized membrane-anchored protein